MLQAIDTELSRGRAIVVHCRQGIGGSGLIAASLLIAKGIEPKAALSRITKARGIEVPETQEQREWIEKFAARINSAASRH